MNRLNGFVEFLLCFRKDICDKHVFALSLTTRTRCQHIRWQTEKYFTEYFWTKLVRIVVEYSHWLGVQGVSVVVDYADLLSVGSLTTQRVRLDSDYAGSVSVQSKLRRQDNNYGGIDSFSHAWHCSVVDPNKLNLDPYPGFWPNLDPDPGLCY